MKLTTVLLFVVLIVGAVLRSWQAGESLWVDELHTSWAVSGSLADVSERAAIGNQSPLYFWLAWFFARLPIQPEIALRLPSLLAGCALPAAVCWLTWRFTKQAEHPPVIAPGLLAAALVAIDPLAIFYSQEARPYVLVMLAAVLHIGLLLAVLQHNQWRARIAWIVTGAILVHLHSTAGLVLLAEAVALLAIALQSPQLPGEQRPSHFARLLDFALLTLLLLPAVPGALDVFQRRENWATVVSPQPFIELLRLFPWTIAVGAVWLPLKRPMLERNAAILLTSWAILPLLVTWLLTYFGIAAIFSPRYLTPIWPASIIAAGLLWQLAAAPMSKWILAAAILGWAVFNGQLIENWLHDGRPLQYRKEDWRAAIATLNSELKTDPGPVLIGSGLIEADELRQRNDPLFREYCELPVRGIYRLSDVETHPLTRARPGQLVPTTANKLKDSKVIWLLIRGDVEASGEILVDLKKSLADDSWQPDEPQAFGHVYWLRIELRKPSVSGVRELDAHRR